jgi:hypothetical protein
MGAQEFYAKQMGIKYLDLTVKTGKVTPVTGRGGP